MNNEKLGRWYSLFVATMVFSIVGVCVYMDQLQEHSPVDLADEAIFAQAVIPASEADVSTSSSPSALVAKLDLPKEPNPSTIGKISESGGNSHARRLLSSFKDAVVVDAIEVVESERVVSRREVLLTKEKYPLITREIRYEWQDQEEEWVPVDGAAWVSDQVLLGLKEGGLEDLQSVLDELDGEVVETIRDGNHYLIEFKDIDEDELEDAVSELELRGSVAYAEPNYYKVPTFIPNDLKYSNQWALNNIGSGMGIYDADIDAPEAWDVSWGASSVVVAVIDTGITLDHPDLVDRIYTNPGETINGVDDDNNGLVDDVNGWCFYDAYNGSSDVSDTSESHGTHISGIIAATGNNQYGVVGVSPGIKVLPIRVFGEDGGYVSDLIKGMDYALNMGVSIINVSLGGSRYSNSEKTMLNTLEDAGVLVVAASGNDGEDSDTNPTYPGSYSNGNIINVAASDWFDEFEDYSTWGNQTVDLCAPGTNILSTFAPDTYAYGSGTSMAAPHVTGVAALIKSIRPGWGAERIKEAILETVDSIPSAVGKTLSGGRLNANTAVLYAMQNTFYPDGFQVWIKSTVNSLYVVPQSGNAQLIANSSERSAAQAYEVVQNANETFSLRSLQNGLYVSAQNQGEDPLAAIATQIGTSEQFEAINMGDGLFAFRACANNQYVTAENLATEPLISNRDEVFGWEVFQVEIDPYFEQHQQVVIQSGASGLFISAESAGVLYPKDQNASDSNIFEIHTNADGSVSLWLVGEACYVSATFDSSIPLSATASNSSEWEQFWVIDRGDNKVSFMSKANGKYISAEDNGLGYLTPTRDEIGGWEEFVIHFL